MTQFVDQPVNVRITRMRQIDDLDRGLTGQADFDSEVTIDGRFFDGQLFEERDDLNPGLAWSFTNTAGSGRVVPFKIRITERDSGFLGGTGPVVDINSLANKKDLDLFLDLQTGEIFSTESGSAQRLGFINQTITLRGFAGDDTQGEISFVVNGTAGPEPTNSVVTQNAFLSETPESNDFLGDKGFNGTNAIANSPIVTGDFNADGKADLVVGSFIDGVAHVIRGSSGGLDQSSLQTRFNTSNLGVAINGSAFAVGDINGDRVDDLVLGGDTTVVRFGSAGSGLNGVQNNLFRDAFFSSNVSFGATVAAGDFNGDGKDDVVVADPSATVSGQSGTGAIQVNYGSTFGITNNRQVFHRDTPGILGLANANAKFGGTLAAGDVNGDGFEDLVVGAAGAPDRAAGAGTVHILYGSATGLTTASNQLFGQFASGQTDQSGDRFGAAIAVADVNGDRVADVIVGAPGKDSGAGQAYVYHGRRGQPLSTIASRILTQPNLLSGAAEAGDNFGATLDAKDLNNDGFADVIIGTPGENNRTGIVHVTFGSSAGVTSNVRSFDQGSFGAGGISEQGDRFGTGIAVGNFDGTGSAEIAVSAPGESFAGLSGAGLVNILPLSSTSAFSLSNIESVKSGNNRSELLKGADVNGTINGGGGNDRVFTAGGHDLALGGAGNDYLDAGAGDDLLHGGKGQDTCKGGKGRDIFVLAANQGPDLIKDFRNGIDRLGLTPDLLVEDLQMIRQGNRTVIEADGDRLAVLQGIKPNQLSAENFVQVDFTQFRNMTVPTVVG